MSGALTALAKASKGLLYPSETDALFEVFEWTGVAGEMSPAKLLALAKLSPATAVTVNTVDDFFSPLVAEADWHGREEKAIVQKFKQLRQAVDAQLADVKVFRIGAIEITIYLVGKTQDGDWVGLKTMAVET